MSSKSPTDSSLVSKAYPFGIWFGRLRNRKRKSVIPSTTEIINLSDDEKMHLPAETAELTTQHKLECCQRRQHNNRDLDHAIFVSLEAASSQAAEQSIQQSITRRGSGGLSG